MPFLPPTSITTLLAPGLISVKRCTRGSVRIEEPPSVAAAVEIMDNVDDCAVRKVSMERTESGRAGTRMLEVSAAIWAMLDDSTFNGDRESDLVEVVGDIDDNVSCIFGDGRMVRIDDSEGGSGLELSGECERTTEVLYSNPVLVLSSDFVTRLLPG